MKSLRHAFGSRQDIIKRAQLDVLALQEAAAASNKKHTNKQ